MQSTVRWFSLGLLTLCVLLCPSLGAAQTFNSGSTGADGPFSPTSNTTLTLPPNGVFNFTTITIPTGVTLKFARNAANTPVVLLATGNVVINGTIDVSGQQGGAFGRPGRGGPGGFDGGAGSDAVTTTAGGAGQGPGGGGAGSLAGGGGGGCATAGSAGTGGGAGGAAYGSALLRPIVGGSGGGGGGSSMGYATGGAGGGGGGAIIIASSTSIALNPAYPSAAITADGGGGGDTCGGGGYTCGAGGGGSGGAIRLIAPTISGISGTLYARGGNYGYPYNGGPGGAGRIRLEAATLTATLGYTSPYPTTAYPQPAFPPAGQPALTIASVGGVPAPAVPTGNIAANPDILLPVGATNPVDVVITASNIPLGTAILVTATPQTGAKTSVTSGGLTGAVGSSTATAGLTLNLAQTSVLTATATYPLLATAGEGPLYAEGEEVTHVRVAAVMGGESSVTYLTRSGREVALP